VMGPVAFGGALVRQVFGQVTALPGLNALHRFTSKNRPSQSAVRKWTVSPRPE